jgi:hypothetical protein
MTETSETHLSELAFASLDLVPSVAQGIRDAGFVDLRDYCISSVFLARNSDQSFNAFAWSQIPRYLDRVFLIFGHEQTRPASPAFLFE